MIIIDGTNLILGRLASHAAKNALNGEHVIIVNCEKVVVTGPKKFTFASMMQREHRGGPYKGPFLPKMPDRFVRRSIRGMLPHTQERGRKAYDNIHCFIGVPDKYKSEKLITFADANASKLKTLNHLQVSDIAHAFGKTI